MNKTEKYNDLKDIVTALRQKEDLARLRGEQQTATALAQTVQKLECYIIKKQKTHSKMF